MPESKAVRADQNSVEPINIVVQADERFAPYLASMLTSLLENNRTQKLNVFLLVTFDHLDNTWANIKLLSASLNLQLLSIDKEKMRDLPCIPHVGPATYYKLFLGDLLPND